MIALAIELFAAPVNIDNAIEFYADLYGQPAITEAPATSQPEDVVDAEFVDDEDPA